MSVFSEDTVKFLEEVTSQNSREWFNQNKQWYNDALMMPLKNFVGSLSDTMYSIDNEFELTPSVNKTISRINRDIRFSKDKSLYKSKMWVTFRKAGKDKIDYPAYFFELSPYHFRYGMGFFSASTSSMNSLKDLMQKKENKFIKIVNEIEARGTFHVEGEMYKRNLFADKDPELQKWYNRKNIYLVYQSEMVGELFQEEFMDNLKEDFKTLEDLYKFFMESMEK